MQALEFDLWRAAYPHLSVAEHAAFYKRLHEDHPDQMHFNGPDALRFFAEIPSDRLDVAELGGYDGALALHALTNSPKIRSWDNFDIAPPVQLLDGDPYTVHTLETQFWDTGIPFEWDVFVASHVIEHLSPLDFSRLLAYVKPARWVYLDSPLHESQATDWNGATCAHVLPFSWADVHDYMDLHGFDRWLTLDSARAYRRKA